MKHLWQFTSGFIGTNFSGTPVSSTNNIDRRDITEKLLKVALNTVQQPNLFQKRVEGTNFNI